MEGSAIVAYGTPPGGHLHTDQADLNKALSSSRAAAERAAASVKTWRTLSEEGGRYRAPITKYAEMLAAVTGAVLLQQLLQPLMNKPLDLLS